MNETLDHKLVIRGHEIEGVKRFINETKRLLETHGWCPSLQSDQNSEKLDLQKALLSVDFEPSLGGTTTELLYVKTRNFLHSLLGVESLLGFDNKQGNTQSNVIAFLDYALYMLDKKGIDDEPCKDR